MSRPTNTALAEAIRQIARMLLAIAAQLGDEK